MAHLCCLRCSLRFASPATLSACPECGRPLDATGDAESLLGFKFFGAPAASPLPGAVVVSLPAFDLKYTRGG
jgi:hypothetical protein